MSVRGGGRSGAKGPLPAEACSTWLVHDLKNLAGRLSALCQNLQQHYDDPLFKRTALDLLDDTVLHLQRLAGDLRERDGRVLVKLRVDLNRVLEDALVDARPDLAGQVELVEHYDELPQVWGDAYLLRQAFACAIENALEAMGGKGTLSVSTRRRRRSGRTRVVVEIADDGPGMDDAFLRERLFHPFSSTKPDGLGLGVYTMRQVAALHAATVSIQSAEGEGTRVRFSIPTE